jgi:uncharacterized membrane protein
MSNDMDAFFPFHPRLVHFPIGLTLVGVGVVAAGILWRREQWVACGRFSLLLGWIGAAVAALAGLVDQSRAPATEVVTRTINQHITAGIALLVVLGLALYWPLRDKKLLVGTWRRWAYLGLLLLAAVLTLIEAWLGGQLVYRLGVGVG